MINHVSTILINKHHTDRPGYGTFGDSFCPLDFVPVDYSGFELELHKRLMPTGDYIHDMMYAVAADKLMIADRSLYNSYYPDIRVVYEALPDSGIVYTGVDSASKTEMPTGRAMLEYLVTFDTFPAASYVEAVNGGTGDIVGTDIGGVYEFELPGVRCTVSDWSGSANIRRTKIPALDFIATATWAKDKFNDEVLQLFSNNQDLINCWRSDINIYRATALLYGFVLYAGGRG